MILAVAPLLIVHTSAAFFECGDTDFGESGPPSLLRSQFHLIQLFGDGSARRTNFFEDDYDGLVAWSEGRFFFPRTSEIFELPIALPDPYLVASLKGLKDLDWEDRLDYGIGLEWRPLKHLALGEAPVLGWVHHLRIYVVSLRTEYLQEQPGWGWRPDDDLRIGLELYRECNLYASGFETESIFWSEIWADLSWRESNFFIEDYRSWTLAIAPRIGIRLLRNREKAIMPYGIGELLATERSDFWQNRLLAGLGVRVMPFRWQHGRTADLLKGTRVYVESLWKIADLKDPALEGTPSYDVRLGVSYTINRW